MKKRSICWLLIALLVCGCGAGKRAQSPTVEPEVVAPDNAPAETSGADESARYGVYSLDGGELSEESGNYDSDAADENALLSRDGADFTITNADINKTGDSASDLFLGLNAAAASVSGAQLTLDGCTLTTNGLGASGLYCGGEGARLTVGGSQIVTAGGNSPTLVLASGGSALIKGSRLMSEAADTPLIAARGDTSVTLSDCTLQSAAAHAVETRAGMLTLWLDAQVYTGDIRLIDDEEAPAGLTLMMQNGAAFTGSILADNTDAVHVSMDESAVWTLTAEQYISGLIAPDTKFAGIQSNGFNLYYNAELEANAWLRSQAYMLPGGGCLSPLI